jgi:ATP-dependent DNA helicase RecG
LTTVDHLLILQYLLHKAEIDSASAAQICQRSQGEAREILSRMERNLGYLDRGGGGRGTYWTLRAALHQRIAAPGDLERDRRLDWEALKTRVLSVICRRAHRGEGPMSNAEVRRITALDRKQVNRLIHELGKEGQVRIAGHGRGARYIYTGAFEEGQ